MHARVGRDKQRYGSDGERLVAGTIPIRVKETESGTRIEVCMISSRGKGHGNIWCIPKVSSLFCIMTAVALIMSVCHVMHHNNE